MSKKNWIAGYGFKRHLLQMIKHRSHDIRDYLAERGMIAAKISQVLEVGTYTDYAKGYKVHGPHVAFVTGGMDCDCATWENHVTMLPALPRYVMKAIDDMYEHADGRRHYRLMKPSEALKLKRTSRDLALEAFEDGHPHVVYDDPPVNALGLTDGEVYDGY
jgi:hypothetical protein